MPAQTAENRVLKKNLAKISEGLLSTATDAVLFTLFLPVASFGTRPTSYGVYQTFQEANEMLEKINYKTFKNALYRLCRKGLIKPLAKKLTEIEITELGRKRLEELSPKYQENRPWNKMIYLINYDIKDKKNRQRDLFRRFLKEIGAAKIQQSLYFIPYNPKTLIAEFIKNHQIKGQILISELGQDSSLGDDDLKEFLNKAYHLEKLNERYEDFIQRYKNIKGVKFKSQVALDFYSILKDDPQIPFELLPSEFSSDEAYLLFKKLTK